MRDFSRTPIRAAILHGAGYTGMQLARLLIGHPAADLVRVTSRSFAGQPLWTAEPSLRGATDLDFTAPDDFDPADLDVVFVTAEHGQGAVAVRAVLDQAYPGRIIDLSADFRLKDPSAYEARYGRAHPAPDLAGQFVYGLAEVNSPYPNGQRFVANPGCYATALALALWPAARSLPGMHAAVTALTGASGSGVKPSQTTHFPGRDGNVRAYRVMDHPHLPEVLQVLGPESRVDFVPVSGPWTRGIWGTAHVRLPAGVGADTVAGWYESAYAGRPLVRLWPDRLPELHWAVGTNGADLGWMVRDGTLVLGFAIDNLLKGASGQAVQNMNLLFGLPETTGLVPG